MVDTAALGSCNVIDIESRSAGSLAGVDGCRTGTQTVICATNKARIAGKVRAHLEAAAVNGADKYVVEDRVGAA